MLKLFYICGMIYNFFSTELKSDPGVYFVMNTTTGFLYIGGSKNVARRMKNHVNELTNGKHCNKRMQRDFDNIGPSLFAVGVLEYCIKEQIGIKEPFWAAFAGKHRLYNEMSIMCKDANGFRVYATPTGSQLPCLVIKACEYPKNNAKK